MNPDQTVLWSSLIWVHIVNNMGNQGISAEDIADICCEWRGVKGSKLFIIHKFKIRPLLMSLYIRPKLNKSTASTA